MPVGRLTRLLILTLLVSLLATVVYRRGFGWRLGAAPAALEGEYLTEEAWIVGEIVRDIAEMSAYPAPLPGALMIVPASADAGKFTVSFEGSATQIDLDLRKEVWYPAAFSGIARAALARTHADTNARTAGRAATPVYPALVDLRPAALVSASSSISRALSLNMRDAGAHEAAALTLGAFALRESAARTGDTRWAMNRMTAHLAMAYALDAAGHGVDGQLAEALLLALANHQTRALTLLGKLTTPDANRSMDAWIRALRLRTTQDWRAIPFPMRATLIEKNEFFRARRATARSVRGSVELSRLGEEPDANWGRVMQASSNGVEDGGLLKDALDWEIDEYRDVYQRLHGTDLGRNQSDALNMPAGRLIGPDGPEVLPWGAWAEFAQRHLAMFVGRSDAFYRHMIGSEGAADQEKRRLQHELGALWMFPSATVWWTKGPRGAEADLRYINDAIDEAVARPQRLTAMAWSFIETGAKFEPVRRGMPPARGWFMRPQPRAMYDAASRVKDSGHSMSLADLTAMMRDAPYDHLLAAEYLTRKYGDKPPYDEILRVAGARKDYDLRVLRLARQHVSDDAAKLLLLRRSCEVSSAECIALAAEHASKNRDDDAAAGYERAFADPSLDAVTVSNASGWLVSHYYRHRKLKPALQLAEQSARTGSFQGLVTLAYLYERLERWDDAEEVYRKAATRYNNPSQLLGFYYRAVHLHKQTGLEPAWQQELTRVFPHGLTAVAGDTPPKSGVVIAKDNDFVRKAGLQAGDVIIGLEGWRVDDYRQYSAVNAFFEHDVVKLTAWRGRPFDVTLRTPNRLMGVELRTYPIEGWGE